jgi:transglutaminase-like putative cysteine protease
MTLLRTANSRLGGRPKSGAFAAGITVRVRSTTQHAQRAPRPSTRPDPRFGRVVTARRLLAAYLPQQTFLPCCALAALTLLAAICFRPVFEVWRFLLPVGAVVFIALIMAAVGDRLRLRTGSAFLLQLIVTVLCLPGVLRVPGAYHGLPTPIGVVETVRGLVEGPARLLTSPVPARASNELLAAPVVAVWLGFVGGWLLLRRFRPVTSMLGPLGVFVGALAFGPRGQRSLLVASTAFAAGTLLYSTLLNRTANRTIRVAGTRWKRPIRGCGILVVAVGSAVLVAPHIPLLSTRDRFTLREWREHPFDPRELASPLAEFARFFEPRVRQATLFSATGASPKRWRLAVLTAYDGRVWSVGVPGELNGGVFERLGGRLHRRDLLPSAPLRRSTVKLEGLVPPWLPLPGPGTALRAESAVREQLRYNLANDMLVAATNNTLRTTYEFEWLDQPEPLEAILEGAQANSSAGVDPLPDLPVALGRKADEFTSGAKSDYAKARALEVRLHDIGYYSEEVAPGHSYGSLAQMIGSKESLVGNDEQYAALFATMARALHLPVRVVVGFVSKKPTKAQSSGPVGVSGDQARAWPEVHFGNVWVPFDPTPPRTRSPKARETRAESAIDNSPPPPIISPRAPPPDNHVDDTPTKKTKPKPPKTARFVVPTAILVPAATGTFLALVVAAELALAVMLKSRRRKRRRTDRPVAAIAGAWQEVLDRAVEAGASSSRHETIGQIRARLYGSDDPKLALLKQLGDLAEHAAFAPEAPSGAQAAAAWQIADSFRTRLRSEATRMQHLRRLASLKPLRSNT